MSSHHHKNKFTDRDRARSRSRERDRARGREKISSRHKDRDRSRSRDRDREGDRRQFSRHDDEGRRQSRDYTSRTSRGGGDDARGKSHRHDAHSYRNNRLDNDVKNISPRYEEARGVLFSSDLDDGFFDKSRQQGVDDDFDDNAMAEINNFLEEEEQEETEEERLAREEEERRKRREAILNKHNQQQREDENVKVGHPSRNDETVSPKESAENSLGYKMAAEKNKPIVTSSIATEEDLAREEVALAQEEENEKHNVKTFDIFSSSPTTLTMAATGLVGKRANKVALLEGDDPLLDSNWDDGEGYYSTRVGDYICGRYKVLGEVGKGVFSTAVKCKDVKGTNKPLAVLKIIRNNDIMRKASEKEIFLLQLIAQTDPQNKKHCVRLIGNMEHRNHVVLAFEAMGMNLRETVKKFGKHVGINVTAVRLYARQLFVALRHLAELKVVHADIKPDNILVSEDLKQVKICDFGSAFRETDSDNDPTPYLQSRFYRAPEIVLGLNYDRMIDLWSVGACIYELFTGHVMFAGRTNNEMLRLQMEFKGKIPNKVVKAHIRSFDVLNLEPHFDSEYKFKMHDIDPVTNKPTMRLVDITAPKKSISAVLLQSKAGADDRQMVLRVADALEKCLVLDSSKRATVQEILKHPLFTTK